ncbi:uncharacterized protein Z518_09021 [Rhinocladiella mackenziei CBS 650.93]|uniref:CFEM domain-containing protein n=1 Tax=Rhinocladiella mackenziei CBS 650.93 TaxID=1442369 RepID=A0A0D2IDI4_9EURO|nr:uncharacterized protein Z518_09021 [Rhinocladiella mackenziei CBS 650.93]KIX01296.1 hypothetical protein Z518_09021 [Rhinocladiella mackenziei CBS 650.93]
MKPQHVLFLFTFLVGASVGQNSLLDQLPRCAVQCFNQAISTSSCSPSDIACLCGDTQFMHAAAACEAVDCTVKETLTSTNATLAACGVPPNDASTTVMAIPAAFGSLAILMVVLRIADRLWDNKITLSWEDYFVVIATVWDENKTLLLWSSNVNLVAALGMGKDFWAVKFDHINKVFQLLYVAEIFYMAAEVFVQLSLLAFYLRVFGTREFQGAVFVLMGVAICFGIANTFTMVSQCTPVPFFWQGWAGETKGKCININLFSWIRAGVEIAIDVAILSLPIPMLLKLQMRWKKKIQVVMMFSVGFVITLVSVLRLRSLIQFSKTTNPTHDNAPAVYWSVLECDMFIICACMPSTRKFLTRIWPTCFGSTVNQGYYDRAKQVNREGLGPNAQYRRQPSGEQHHQQYNASSKGTVILKSIDVDVYRTERSESDVELGEPRSGQVYGI